MGVTEKSLPQPAHSCISCMISILQPKAGLLLNKAEKERNIPMITGKWFLLLSLSLGMVFVMNTASHSRPSSKDGGTGAFIEASIPGAASFINSDLFHRNYNMGIHLIPGKIIIKKDDILKACEAPDAVLIYNSDITYDSVPFEERDFEYEIKSEGHYCFFVLDKDEDLTDITDTIIKEPGDLDHILPKQSKAKPPLIVIMSFAGYYFNSILSCPVNQTVGLVNPSAPKSFKISPQGFRFTNSF